MVKYSLDIEQTAKSEHRICSFGGQSRKPSYAITEIMRRLHHLQQEFDDAEAPCRLNIAIEISSQ